MKAPKCPECGKEHYSTQRCGVARQSKMGLGESPLSEPSAAEPDFKKVHRGSSSGDQDAPVSRGAAGAGPKQSEASGMLQGPPLTSAETIEDYRERLRIDGIIQDKNIRKQALTSAEKQKAYRKRLKDDPKAYEDYLEANKLRMRRKRDGT